MGIKPGRRARQAWWGPNIFGIHVGTGFYDTWRWEAYYSPKLWDSMEARIAPLEPDLDGTRRSEVQWSGWPDGGLSAEVWMRGWEPELGSEEEIEFLAAVAVKETEGVDMSNLDYEVRSHMLLGVMRVAFESRREKHLEDLKRRIIDAGRVDEDKAEQWVQEALKVMEPYVQKWDGWPAAEDRSELLRHILVENGQLFGRWKLAKGSKEFYFELKAPRAYCS